MVEEYEDLQLRLGEHEVPDEIVGLADFSEPSGDLAQLADIELCLIPGGHGRTPSSMLPLHLPEFGIPPFDDDDHQPSPASWRIGSSVTRMSTSRSRSSLGPRVGLVHEFARAMMTAGVTVPLAAAPLPATASAGSPQPAETTRTMDPTAAESAVLPQPPSLPDGESAPPADRAWIPPASPAVTAPPDVVQAAWEGVVGYDVVMELGDGAVLEGRVSAVQIHTFTLIDFAAGGVVRVLQKSAVKSLRVRTDPPVPVDRGSGLLAGGAVLTAIGIPLTIAGLTMLGILPSYFVLWLPILLPGLAALGSGIPLIVKGQRRRRAWNEAMAERRLAIAPTVSRNRHGTWTGGLTFRLGF